LCHQLATGDAAGIAAAADRFNHRVRTLTKTVAFRPFEPILAAVGN
jgi:hypothetical protein